MSRENAVETDLDNRDESGNNNSDTTGPELQEQDGFIKGTETLGDSFRSHLHSYRTRITYIILAALVSLVALSAGLPVIARGAILASVIFTFHESLHSKVNQICDLVYDRHEGHTDRTQPLLAVIGIAIVDLLIAVPMFSPGEYVWPYTLALALHFVMAVILYGGIQWLQGEVRDIIQSCLSQPYKTAGVIVAVFILDLYFVYTISAAPKVQLYQIILAPEQVIESEGSVLFLFASLAASVTLLIFSTVVLLASLWLSLIALGMLVPILLLFAPGSVFTGLETAPYSVRVWAALGVVVFTLVSALPSVIKSRGWFLNE